MPAAVDYLPASNGTGEAVRAIVTTERLVSSVSIITDSVLRWPLRFVATSGTLITATGLLDPATITVFKGVLTGSIITIEAYAPGYSDIGHSVGQVIVLKPSTFWADTLAEAVALGGSADSVVVKAIPAGLVNSSNTVFTAPQPYVAGTLQVYINGVAQSGLVAETTPTTGVFTVTPAPFTGDDVSIYYHVANTAVGNADSLSGFNITALLQAIYPVGSVFVSGQATMPAIVSGIGTWTALEGRVIVGKAAAGTFNTVNATGGTETHTLTTAEMPSHNHNAIGNTATTPAGNSLQDKANGNNTGNGYPTSSTGGGAAHNNLQPYKVKYMWERTT